MPETKVTIQNNAVPSALAAFFKEVPKAALAFSGGVDSSYLLYAAVQCGADVRAYYVDSQFQPAFERVDAQRLAGELAAALSVLPLNALADDAVAANPPNRCYHCKKHIFGSILQRAAADGYSVVLDGTNASDDASDRPGMRALRELSVRSPLREAGLTKPQVREYSRQAGLFTWDKPAYACLATRIPAGVRITDALLQKVERAETALAKMGFVDFRVRVLGDAAKVQLPEGQFGLVLQRRAEIVEVLSADFEDVLLDLKPR